MAEASPSGTRLTQDALARQVGCARGHHPQARGDEMRPSKQLAELLAEQLGISPEERAAFVRLGEMALPIDSTTATTPRHNCRLIRAVLSAASASWRRLSSAPKLAPGDLDRLGRDRQDAAGPPGGQ